MHAALAKPTPFTTFRVSNLSYDSRFGYGLTHHHGYAVDKMGENNTEAHSSCANFNKHFKLWKVRKGRRTKVPVGSDQQMQKLEKTELRKADPTVGVNCHIFSNKFSAGTA